MRYSWVPPGTDMLHGDIRGDGTGTANNCARNKAEVARRLWFGKYFDGVAPDELRELIEYGHNVEIFSTPISQANIPLPFTIQWSSSDRLQPNPETYTVENVEFTYQADPRLFEEAKRKHFPKWDAFPPQPVAAPRNRPEREAMRGLEMAKQDAAAASAFLRAAMKEYPLDKPLGASDQSTLLAALWQMEGLKMKEELVDWFYLTLQTAPSDPENSSHGVLDHGPLSLLYAIDTRQPAENAKLLAAIVADARFERTDAAVLKQMLHMSALGYSVLASMPLDPEMHDNHLSPNLLELWRTILRQHYAAHPL